MDHFRPEYAPIDKARGVNSPQIFRHFGTECGCDAIFRPHLDAMEMERKKPKVMVAMEVECRNVNRNW